LKRLLAHQLASHAFEGHTAGAGFVNEKKEFPRQKFAFCVDGLSSVLGSLMGTSPIAAFIESASGIREGGRTGLTAVCVAAWFFVALFFTPVLCASNPLISPYLPV
jgi:AGZA family xanthine/uracil permease-like MFS transporter